MNLFDNPINKIVADAMLQMRKERIPVDLVTIFDWLNKANRIEEVGGMLSITKLTDKVGSSVHLESHIQILKNCYIKRSLVNLCQQGINSVAINDEIEHTLARVQKGIEEITEGAFSNDRLKPLSEFVKASISSIYERVEQFRKGITPGVTTGLKDLDKILDGWQDGKLNIIAARPAMGKTALAMKFAKAAALSGKNVAIFSLEMDGESLSDRLILSESNVEAWRYNSGGVSDEELQEIDKDVAPLFKLPIYIDDNSNTTIRKIESKARYLQKRQGCDMIIIDYLQLTEGEERSGNREQEISSISRNAKKMARTLNVPVILLSQLSRAVETRPNKRPILADLRESGAIEQDADTVTFIYRAEYYTDSDGNNLKLLDEYQNEIDRGIELIIAKNRKGATGSMYCQHDGTLNKIYDYERYSNYNPNGFIEPKSKDPF